MIRGVVELSETTVKEVMVPRIDVLFLPVDISVDGLLERIEDNQHSRYPVYRDTIDNVIGVLYVKDLLRAMIRKEDLKLETIIRKPYFVPESKRIDSLLREFKRRHVHIAIAVDEYGGVSGIVCLEDIIEEIVGDIQDEHDGQIEDWYTRLDAGRFLVAGAVPVKDVNALVPLAIPEKKDYTTLAGFFLYEFGRLPHEKEAFEWNGFRLSVEKMIKRRIALVEVAPAPGPGPHAS